ncbi:MAG: tetratricopeptide repeat protein [Thermoplasmata archaeon]
MNKKEISKSLEKFVFSLAQEREAHTRFRKGLKYVEAGKYEDAQKIFDEIFELVAPKLSQELRDGILGYLLITDGDMLMSLGKYSKAIRVWEMALKIHRKTGEEELVVSELSALGAAYMNLGKFDEAINYLQEALEVCRKKGYELMEADCYRSFGEVFRALGNREKAEEYYNRAIAIFEKLKNLRGLAMCHGSLGVMYGRANENEKAISEIEKAIELHRKTKDREYVAADYQNLANVYYNLDKYKMVIDYCKKAIEVYNGLNGDFSEEIKKCYLLMGKGYEKMGDKNKARECVKKAKEARKEK